MFAKILDFVLVPQPQSNKLLAMVIVFLASLFSLVRSHYLPAERAVQNYKYYDWETDYDLERTLANQQRLSLILTLYSLVVIALNLLFGYKLLHLGFILTLPLLVTGLLKLGGYVKKPPE